MQEIRISKVTASKIIKDYFNFHFYNKVGVKIKSKIKDNHIYMIVNLQILVDNKRTNENRILTETQIAEIIEEYLTISSCDVQDVKYEPELHTFNIKYDGDYVEKYKKIYIKKKEVI